MDPRLGRIKRKDFRDHRFLVAQQVSTEAGIISRKRWNPAAVLDQEDTPQCVAFASTLYLLASPVRNKALTDPTTIRSLYDRAQAIDGWDLPHDGTSVRAAMQILQQDGYLTNYLWAFNASDAARWILTTGPMVFGTDWLNSMFDTKKYKGRSFINYDDTSSIAGGHAYLVLAVDQEVPCPDGSIGAFEMQNSWGPGWGNKGRAWLSFKTAAALLAEGGEAACASEVLKKKT